MADFGDLSKKLREHGDTILVNQNKKTIRVALAIDALVVKVMPVDKGRAKSSVVVTVGESSTLEIRAPYFPGKKGSTAGANTQAAIAQAESALQGREFGQEIHININLPYIDDLNKGHSPQAAAGFIEQSIRDGISTETGVEASLLKRT